MAIPLMVPATPALAQKKPPVTKTMAASDALATTLIRREACFMCSKHNNRAGKRKKGSLRLSRPPAD